MSPEGEAAVVLVDLQVLPQLGEDQGMDGSLSIPRQR